MYVPTNRDHNLAYGPWAEVGCLRLDGIVFWGLNQLCARSRKKIKTTR